MRSGLERRLWIILLLAAVLRMIHLDAMPLGHHGWRQADTAAVARNFSEQGRNLLYPRIDWAVPGYVEMEFPIYPWVASLGYSVLGERVAIARFLAALASVSTVWLVFLLVRRTLGAEAGLWAAFLWAILPLSVYFGRAIMPEAWMLAFSVAGVYLYARWLERPSPWSWLGAAVSVGLACLLKPTALYLGLPLLWLAWRRHGWSLVGRGRLWLFAAAVLLPTLAWYWHAYRLGETYGATFGIVSGPTGKFATLEILSDPGFYRRLFLDFYADRILTWPGSVALLVGILVARRHNGELLFAWWLAGVVAVLLLGAGASSVHEYYALPLLIPSTAFMGRGLVWMRERSRIALLVVVCGVVLASAARSWSYFERETAAGGGFKTAQDLLVAGVLESSTRPSELILACDFDPTWFYLGRRKGFARNCDIMDKRSVAALEEQGARYLAARRSDFESATGKALLEHLLVTRKVVFDDGEILLVDLAGNGRSSWQVLLSDDFEDGRPPAQIRFPAGSWQERDGALLGEPARRRLQASLPQANRELCTVRIGVKPERVAPGDRRRSVITLKGWSTDARHLEATIDLAAGRVALEQFEDGEIVGRDSRPWRVDYGESQELEITFDGFDFELVLNRKIALSLPSKLPAAPAGRVEVGARNLRLGIERFEIRAPARPPAAELDSIDVAPVWAGHPVNFAIVTEGEHQYVGFYDPRRQMTIAQRRLDSARWKFTKLPSRVEWDSHNDISLAVDRDGFLHVSGNVHGDPLVYFRSIGPHDISAFERARMVGKRERKVTYPRFLESGDGHLYFHYRDGKSGDGSTILNRYEEASRSWSRVLAGPLFDGRGEMSAYLAGPVLGPDGLFHLVWMWRDTPSGATNHDISYARSADLERWENAAGRAVALPFTPDSATTVVDPVPSGAGLSGNAFGVGWDAQRRPVVSYVKYGPAGDSQLFNARFEDGRWRVRRTSSWNLRWDLDATGSLPALIGFYPVSVDREGRLTQAFDHAEAGRGVWILDETTLRPTGRTEEPAFFSTLRAVESSFPGMEVRPLIRDRTGEYLLRWETLPIRRDRPREAPYPPPSILRVVRVPSESERAPATDP